MTYNSTLSLIAIALAIQLLAILSLRNTLRMHQRIRWLIKEVERLSDEH